MTAPARALCLAALSLAALAVAASCSAPAADAGADSTRGSATTDSGADTTQATFWSALQGLCGRAFRGVLVEGNASDSAFRRDTLVMHVRGCTPDEIRVPFHAGANRSRTWVFTRTAAGLRLKHDHRHEDGAADSITQYGGDTRDAGTGTRQDFFADSLTAALIPAARTNVWTVEVIPGQRFAYALRREGTDRRFRVEFDLTSPVTAPPPPWGSQ